ncbi:MAG: hypothetical protein J0L78_16935, partial [Planctomycetes bacterium]|nr:hypothetical protein [Planctomycetota bacterium]
GGGPMEDPAAGRHRALGAESDTDKQAAAGVNGPQAAAGVPRPTKTPAKYIAPTGEGSSGCLQSWFFNDLLEFLDDAAFKTAGVFLAHAERGCRRARFPGSVAAAASPEDTLTRRAIGGRSTVC